MARRAQLRVHRNSEHQPARAPVRPPERKEGNGHPALELQSSAGNAAVARAVESGTLQRFSFSDVIEKGKELIGSEDKSNLEITAEEFSGDLEAVIDKLEKAKTVAELSGADQFTEGLGGVADGLGKIKGPIDKILKVQGLARDLRKFYRAVKKLQSIDLNRDYEEGADAMSDLAEVAGKLGGAALPEELGGVGAYFKIIEGSGAIFKMGARLRKKKEAQLDPDKYHELLEQELKATPPPPKPTASETTTLEQLPQFVDAALAQAETESKAAQNWAFAGWVIYKNDFHGAYDEFMGYHKQQQELPFYERSKYTSSEYRRLTIYEREPWEKANQALQDMERWIGRDPTYSVSFQPALKAWQSAKP